MPYLVLLALGAALAATVGYARAHRKGSFDRHLPPLFETSVLHALKTEKDPIPLRTYGEAMLSDYPVAAGVLLTRARNLVQSDDVSGFARSRERIGRTRPQGLRRTREEADDAQKVAGAIAADPRLARIPPTKLAERLEVPLNVVQAVLASTDSAGHGLIVDPNVLVSYVGEPSPPPSVAREHVVLAIAATKGKPSAIKALNHLRMQDAKAAGAAERTVAQALWAKTYTPKKE